VLARGDKIAQFCLLFVTVEGFCKGAVSAWERRMSLYGDASPAPAYEIFRDEICEISFVPSKTRY